MQNSSQRPCCEFATETQEYKLLRSFDGMLGRLGGHGAIVVSTVASQHGGHGFDSWPLCAVCMFSLVCLASVIPRTAKLRAEFPHGRAAADPQPVRHLVDECWCWPSSFVFILIVEAFVDSATKKTLTSARESKSITRLSAMFWHNI